MKEAELFAAVQHVANQARFALRDIIIDYAEAAKHPGLSEKEIFCSVLVGVNSATVEILKALGDTGQVHDPQGVFEAMIRQMADVWGQAHGFPGQPSGSIQQ